jgi:hypothetical protein
MDNPCRMASVLESVSFAHRRSGSSCIRHLPVRGCWRLALFLFRVLTWRIFGAWGAILRIGPHSTALYAANNSCPPSCRRVQRVPCRDDGLAPQAGREVGWKVTCLRLGLQRSAQNPGAGITFYRSAVTGDARAAIMPSSSSPGLMPVRASTAV